MRFYILIHSFDFYNIVFTNLISLKVSRIQEIGKKAYCIYMETRLASVCVVALPSLFFVSIFGLIGKRFLSMLVRLLFRTRVTSTDQISLHTLKKFA